MRQLREPVYLLISLWTQNGKIHTFRSITLSQKIRSSWEWYHSTRLDEIYRSRIICLMFDQLFMFEFSKYFQNLAFLYTVLPITFAGTVHSGSGWYHSMRLDEIYRSINICCMFRRFLKTKFQKNSYFRGRILNVVVTNGS